MRNIGMGYNDAPLAGTLAFFRKHIVMKIKRIYSGKKLESGSPGWYLWELFNYYSVYEGVVLGGKLAKTKQRNGALYPIK